MKATTYRVMIQTLERLRKEQLEWLNTHRDKLAGDWPRAADIETIERGLRLPGAIAQAWKHSAQTH